MEKWEIRPPLPQKPLNRSLPEFVWVIMSGIPTPVQNFITIRLPPSLPNIRNCSSSDWASFLVLPSAYSQLRLLHRFSQSIRQMTSFRSRTCLLGIPKTKFYISTPFSPQNANFWSTFDGTYKKLCCCQKFP